MMLKGNTNLWKLFTLVFFILSAFTPMTFAYIVALPLLWFFQTLLLSKLGSREITTRCDDYIFSSPFPLLRQLPATFTAATLFMVVLALPVIIRLAIAGDFYGVVAVLIGALFIPVAAITFGIATLITCKLSICIHFKPAICCCRFFWFKTVIPKTRN
jgi:hypothetical protein